MKILIETIPHSAQRYPTVGDWQWTNNTTLRDLALERSFSVPAGTENNYRHRTYPDTQPILHIRVSSLSNWRYEALVGLHEAIEALLCKHAGVTEEQVDQFDLNFQGIGEPGEDAKAPYHSQHIKAATIEQHVARWLGVDWATYEAEVDSL